MIPEVGGNDHGFPTVAAAHARIVARLRERGHTLGSTRQRSREGRLAYRFVEEPFSSAGERVSLAEAAEAAGLEPALVERVWSSPGLPGRALEGGGVPAALPGSAAAANRNDSRGDPLPRRRLLRWARGGEVPVTDSVVEAVGRRGDHLESEEISQVKLMGLDQRRRLCRALARE